MPGMGTGLRTNDPTIVSAFHSALLHQGLIVLLILAVAGVTLNVSANAAVPPRRRRQ